MRRNIRGSAKRKEVMRSSRFWILAVLFVILGVVFARVIRVVLRPAIPVNQMRFDTHLVLNGKLFLACGIFL